MEDHATEYSQITDKIFIGSDMCIGPSCPVHCPEFKKLGIRGEINLEMERDESPSPCVDAYLWLPVPNFAAPTQEQLLIGTATINEMINRGMKVYVHCKMGLGRSPTLVAAYFIRYENMTPEQAIAEIAEKRKGLQIEEAQKQALDELFMM